MSKKTQTPPPAYFLSLSLENVRSFGEKQMISFTRPDGRPAQWTIILGDNGVGKTTVLKSLAGIRPNEGLLLRMDIKNPPGIWSPIRGLVNPIPASDFEQKITRENDVNLDYDATLQYQTYLGFCFNKSAPNHIDNSYEPITRTISIPKQNIIGVIRVGTITGSSSYDETVANEFLKGLIGYGYGAGRTVGNSTLTETPATTDTCASLFDDRADLLNPEEWFLQMEYSSLKQDEKAGKALEQVREALLLVLPDVTDIRISSKGHQQYLELETPYGWVRLRDMSLGYQTLVVWLTDFASKLFLRYPDSPNPLEMPAIVLIDEIDLHLHPSWQRKLLGFLSGIFKNTQFIATAHSPLVVQAAGDEGANVVLLKREGDQTVVCQNLEDVRGWRLDQILTSELFGLETARSLQTEEKLQRRAELLTKTNQTKADQQELAQLTQELNAEPLGETPSERDVHAVLQELRQHLQPKDSDPATA